MNTIIDIIRTLSGVIEDVTGSPPTTKDVTEGFDRPCTWIRPITISPDAARNLHHDYQEIEIVYFAPKGWRGWQNLLETQVSLTEALKGPVYVTDAFAIYPEDIEFVPNREDMTLVCTFSLENFQLYTTAEEEAMPTMEELDLTSQDPDEEVYDTDYYMEELESDEEE